jgi:hypothetical protein
MVTVRIRYLGGEVKGLGLAPAVAAPAGRQVKYRLTAGGTMELFGVVFATLGAGMILFALTFVTLLVGALVNAMVVLMSGPLIDKLVARKR